MIGSIVLAGLIAWVRGSDRPTHAGPARMVLQYMGVAAALISVITLVAGLYFAVSVRRVRKRFPKDLQLDMQEGKIEEYRVHVTHAMYVVAAHPDRGALLCRHEGGHVTSILAEAFRTLGISRGAEGPSAPRSQMVLAVLPRSKLVVDVQWFGEPVPFSTRRDIRLRLLDRSNRVWFAPSIKPYIRIMKGGSPPFS